MYYPHSIQNLIREFSRLPGIGPKTAQRLVFYLLSHGKNDIKKFQSALDDMYNAIMTCGTCQNFSESDPCEICKDSKRDRRSICVVAKPQDVPTIEKTDEFHGLYHVLGGTLNPIEGITSEKLAIKQLVQRIQSDSINPPTLVQGSIPRAKDLKPSFIPEGNLPAACLPVRQGRQGPQGIRQDGGVKEIILALNPDIEGETTILYLKKILKPYNVTISRLARGLPMGADLEYADEVTLSNALKGRREV